MYGKHFEKMYTGSLLGAGAEVFALMGYVISHQKPPDFTVEINPKLVCVMLGEPEEEIQEALEFLCAPDPKSRSEKEDGRRLVRVGQFLYRVVNGPDYHGIKSQEELRAYWREQKRNKKTGETAKTQSEPKTDNNAESIYEAYPKKVGKPKALVSIQKAVEKYGYDTIMERTKQYAALTAGADQQFIPHPTTWFNQERFNDEQAAGADPNDPTVVSNWTRQ